MPHVSVYLLEVDEESRLGREMLEKGTRYQRCGGSSEDAAAEWYQQACDTFGAAGLHQYEISNFAREGHASRHNLKYWRRQPYVGFGLDAHSMLRTEAGAVRFANTSDLDAYLGDVRWRETRSVLEDASQTVLLLRWTSSGASRRLRSRCFWGCV